MNAVDTNVVARYLTRDDAEQSQKSAALIEAGPILLLTSVILETAWVLSSSYRFPKTVIVERLRAFAGLPTISLADPDTIPLAFDLMEQGVDFADAIHLAAARGAKTFFTFDLALIKRAQGCGVALAAP